MLIQGANSQAANWQSLMQAWAYAYGRPANTGLVKSKPDDFKVVENLGFELSGEGEHICVRLRKTLNHTAKVAAELARFAHVRRRDVAYCGRKDFFASTEQWFSIYRPTGDALNWEEFECEGVEILELTRHAKKLRLGAHGNNHFEITIRDLSGDLSGLKKCLKLLSEKGVPNYFGEQRFGFQASNIIKAAQFLKRVTQQPARSKHGRSKKRLKDKEAMWVSAARSWLFNCVVSQRVGDQRWANLEVAEPAILNGSQSFFITDSNEDLTSRLLAGDIHPSAPLWGRRLDAASKNLDPDLLGYEQRAMSSCVDLQDGLEQLGLEYKRRSTRCLPRDMTWRFDSENLILSFALPSGEFATSVLRELVDYRSGLANSELANIEKDSIQKASTEKASIE